MKACTKRAWIELHYSLIEDHVIGEVDMLLWDVWNYTEGIDRTSEIVLTDEMYYYYHRECYKR